MPNKPEEASHRFQAVDRILTEVLAWPRNTIYVEKHVDESRIDYLLAEDGVNRAVIEAKSRDTLWFETTHKSGAHFRIGGTVYASEHVQKTVRQASAYCVQTRVGLAAISNGLDWIVFQGNRVDGREVADGEGFLFQGLDGNATRIRLMSTPESGHDLRGYAASKRRAAPSFGETVLVVV